MRQNSDTATSPLVTWLNEDIIKTHLGKYRTELLSLDEINEVSRPKEVRESIERGNLPAYYQSMRKEIVAVYRIR